MSIGPDFPVRKKLLLGTGLDKNSELYRYHTILTLQITVSTMELSVLEIMTDVPQERGEGAKVAECNLPGIQIILLTDENENEIDETGLTWHPGDLLQGRLQISSSVKPNIVRIHVFFEGMVSEKKAARGN
jgi:hypothetical protein